MRKAFIIGAGFMLGSLIPLFALPSYLNVWVWACCMLMGIVINSYSEKKTQSVSDKPTKEVKNE